MEWTIVIFQVAVFSLFVVTTVICLSWSQCCVDCKIMQQKSPRSVIATASAPAVGQGLHPQRPGTIQLQGIAVYPRQDPLLYSGAEPPGEPPPYHEIGAGEGNYTLPASMTMDDCSQPFHSFSKSSGPTTAWW